MDQEWIGSLASEIKSKNHQAAEEYGREQHVAAVIADKAKLFFVSLVQSLQQDVDTLRSQLQDDLTAAETGVQTIRACEVKIFRARFPCVDATLEHSGNVITLEYTKTVGNTAEPAQDRKSETYAFRVAPDDTLYIAAAFSAVTTEYKEPEALAQHITELLFTP